MIAFEPSSEQRTIVEQVRAFAAEEIRPAYRTCEEAGRVSAGIAERAHGLGLSLLEYPEALGGLGLGMGTRVLVEEELAWGDAGIATGLPGPGVAGYAVLECASAAQAVGLLAPFATGAPRWGTLALAEDVPGFEPGGVALSPVREGRGWRLRGRKFPVAPLAADLVVVVAVGPELFALSQEAAGIVFGPPQPGLGLGAVPSGELVLDCLVDESARLERPLRLERVIERARLVVAARAVGLARAAFEYAARYATERRAFGKSIAEHQAPAFMIADMGIAVDAARALLWRAAWRFDTQPEAATVDVAMSLAAALEAAMAVSSDAVQILGGHGFMQDHPVEKWMRDARTLAMAWGTARTAHHIIATAAWR